MPSNRNKRSFELLLEESSDDDEDKENLTTNGSPFQVVVAGAGIDCVNGTYSQDGYFKGAVRYSKDGIWNGNTKKFHIFQCLTGGKTKHWYISIIPEGRRPGTSTDIDLYSCPVNDDCRRIPPRDGWVDHPAGAAPVPLLEFVYLSAAQQQLQERLRSRDVSERATSLESFLEERVVEDIKELKTLVHSRKRRVVEDLKDLRDRKRSLQCTIDRLPSERRARIQLDLDRAVPPPLATAGVVGTKCSICQDCDAVLAVVPCGHMCLCEEGECVNALVASGASICPLCRGNMDGTLKIYLA